MAWMPGTDQSRLASDGNSKLTCVPDIVCLHTIVGYAPALAATFSVRADGYVWQHRDSNKQSAANLNGNDHIIAIENEDHGAAFGNWNTNDGHAVPAFTSAQIEALAKICAWAHVTHGIPLVQCPDSKPGSKGIAYHRQGIDSPNNFAGYAYPGRVAGGEVWTGARGKVCPGDRRIAQIPQIINRAKEIVGGEDLRDDERMWLKGLNDSIGQYYVLSKGKAVGRAIWEIEQALGEAYQLSGGKGIGSLVVDLVNRVKELEAKLENVSTPDVDESAIAEQIVTQLSLKGFPTKEQVIEAINLANKNAWNRQ